MQYLVHAMLGVDTWSWHGEIEWNDLTLCSPVMVEWKTSMREMRGDDGNCHEKLGQRRMSYASQFTIPDRPGTSPDLAHTITTVRSAKSNQASHTPDFSYFHISFLSWSPISLYLPHHYHHRQIQSQVIPLCLSLPWAWVNTVYRLHRVQHTLGTAYTDYIIQPA